MKELKKSRDAILAKSENIWINSIFGFLVPLSSDERGEWGEDYFHQMMKRVTKYLVLWDNTTNIKYDDGIYDLSANKKRTEIKTAMKGTRTNNFQHEHIVEAEYYDILVLQDLTPDDKIYFTIIKNNEMVYEKDIHSIFKTKATPCKGGWKYDMRPSTLNRGIEAGLTYLHDLKKPNYKQLSKFLVRHFR
jgi:hypothetical protein